MCGIAGIYLRQPFKDHEQMEKFVDTLFEGIEHRGRRATGMVAVGPGGHQVTLDKKACAASQFIKTRKQLPEGATMVLCHTRLDTKGSPSNNGNNHPIVYRSTFMVHNGGIWNDDALFAERDLRRNAEVDSEIIAALLAEETLDNPRPALEALEGDFAIAAIDPINYVNRLLLAKGAWSPLWTWENDFGIVWASTSGTIQKAVESVGVKAPSISDMYEFDTGEMWLIEQDGIEKDKFTSKIDDWESGAKKDAKKQARQAQSGYSSSGGDVYGNTQTGYWVSCDACKHHVPYKEIRRDNLRGMLCEDCDTLGLSKRTATPNGKGDADLLLITDSEKRVLETWTKTDQELHSRIITEMAEDTGFSEAAVEWLVFRAPQPYLRNHKNMGELADFLDEIYQERLIGEWEQFNQITMESKPKITGSEDSYEVSDDDYDAEAIEKGEIESCGVEVVKDDTANVVPFRKALPPVRRNDFSCFAGETYRTDCKVCLQDAETQLGIFAYCHKHFDGCNNKDCAVGGGAAIGTDTTGRRLCHGCARGTKGFLADSLLKLNGFEAKPVRA